MFVDLFFEFWEYIFVKNLCLAIEEKFKLKRAKSFKFVFLCLFVCYFSSICVYIYVKLVKDLCFTIEVNFCLI